MGCPLRGNRRGKMILGEFLNTVFMAWYCSCSITAMTDLECCSDPNSLESIQQLCQTFFGQVGILFQCQQPFFYHVDMCSDSNVSEINISCSFPLIDVRDLLLFTSDTIFLVRITATASISFFWTALDIYEALRMQDSKCCFNTVSPQEMISWRISPKFPTS